MKDPVCGMDVDQNTGKRQEYNGSTYYFCSDGCEQKFKSSPERYASEGGMEMQGQGGQGTNRPQGMQGNPGQQRQGGQGQQGQRGQQGQQRPGGQQQQSRQERGGGRAVGQ